MTPLQIELWNDAIWWLDINAEYEAPSFDVYKLHEEYGWFITPDYDTEAWFDLLLIEVLKS